MASLQELLAREGFERGKSLNTEKPVKLQERNIAADESSIVLPIYTCQDLQSFEFSKHKNEKSVMQKGSSLFSSRRVNSDSGRSSSESVLLLGEEPAAIDEVAVKAVVSILSGYIGRYVKDEGFRKMIRDKCDSCLVRNGKDLDNGVLANVGLGIECTEKLVEERGTRKELRMKSLRNAIQLLSIVESVNSKISRNGSTCGIPNSHISACAQLYLSIVYKIEKNNRISARHLLQVFCDSPFLARTHLLPDLWEHVFLPHLLHLKVWYHKELEFLSSSHHWEKEKRMKYLCKVYNDQMDMGTTLFAVYYKQWLKVGAKSPSIPSVPLPSIPRYGSSRRRSSDSYTSHSFINKKLYRTVFGSTLDQRLMNFEERNRASSYTSGLEEEGKVSAEEENYKNCNYVHNKMRTPQRSSSETFRYSKSQLWPEAHKLDHFRFFTCRSIPTGCSVNGYRIVRSNSISKEVNSHLLSSDLSRAITTICSSDSLSDCEIAIRVITKAWLNSHGDPVCEAALSKAPVTGGLLEVLFASSDDEILELAISILAEFVARNGMVRQIIINSDPQLEIFIRLLRSSSLFLKSSVLLYLSKPEAKQMISTEWIPLVLRVLEFGDQLQTLFTVRCSPRVAAFYFLDQLLTGFDEDRNLENAIQVVSLGGLSLLVKSIEKGDVNERNSAVSIISCCIRADGSCRNYLADNLNKASLLELIALGIQNSNGCAFALLTESLCLSRRTQITEFLEGLKNGWDGLDTMQILLAYLQNATPEERPLVAAILLEIDLLGDPLQSSLYREEAIDAIVASLDYRTCSETVQEQAARSLLMLGDCFSSTGKPSAEEWLPQHAGFYESSEDSIHGIGIATYENLNEEKEALRNWRRKLATVLLKSGENRFLDALANSIANGIPYLAKASLFTVAWMGNVFNSIGDGDDNFKSIASTTLLPKLLESSSYDRTLEETVLASFPV